MRVQELGSPCQNETCTDDPRKAWAAMVVRKKMGLVIVCTTLGAAATG